MEREYDSLLRCYAVAIQAEKIVSSRLFLGLFRLVLPGSPGSGLASCLVLFVPSRRIQSRLVYFLASPVSSRRILPIVRAVSSNLVSHRFLSCLVFHL